MQANESERLNARAVKNALALHASEADAAFLQGFFKTGPGQYGESDVFIGVRVPQTRAVCKRFRDLPLAEVQQLLDSPVHEHRLAALIILTLQYTRADEAGQRIIYELYLTNVTRGRINNWDLVDVSADRIVGQWARQTSDAVLFQLARRDNLWARRVAIISTFAFIKAGDPAVTVAIAKVLLHDQHDLLQKAVGWMLREVGKRVDRTVLTDFLDRYAHEMPRTMLRYAVEHLAPADRQRYMQQRAAVA
jgi:3-methyladenine DNA glycosylase AlkD